MNAEERFALIRAKLGRKTVAATTPAGLFVASHPEQARKKRQRVRYTATGYASAPFGVIVGPVKHGMAWDQPAGDLAPSFRVGHRHDLHPLTRIAERLKRR